MVCLKRQLAFIGLCVCGLNLSGCEADTSLVQTDPPVVTVVPAALAYTDIAEDGGLLNDDVFR